MNDIHFYSLSRREQSKALFFSQFCLTLSNQVHNSDRLKCIKTGSLRKQTFLALILYRTFVPEKI